MDLFSPPPATYHLSYVMEFLGSYPGATDWLKILAFGWLLTISRHFIGLLYSNIIGLFCVQASFSEDDYSHQWVLAWMAEQPAQARMRNVDVSTRHQLVDQPHPSRPDAGTSTSNIHASYLPSSSGVAFVWFKGALLSIRCRRDVGGLFGSKERTFDICFYSLDSKILEKFINAARDTFLAANEGTVITYASDSQSNWQKVGWASKTLGLGLVLPPGVAEGLVAKLNEFLSSKAWYSERGIPYRMGILLHGPPGSGKTSLIRHLAAILNLHIYTIHLSRAGLDDTGLATLINALPERCLLVMEDIDAAFTSPMRNRDAIRNSTNDFGSSLTDSPPLSSGVTLSGVLNALDGVGAQEGRILITTTNKYRALDPALVRPGRLDVHLEFKNASKYQAKKLFSRFYLPSLVTNYPNTGQTPRLSGGKTSLFSGQNNIDILLEKAPLLGSPDSPEFDVQLVEELAHKFSTDIPDYKISMASLQGYLMKHKASPTDAAKEVFAWVVEELAYQTSMTERNQTEANFSTTTPPLTPANVNVNGTPLAVPNFY